MARDFVNGKINGVPTVRITGDDFSMSNSWCLGVCACHRNIAAHSMECSVLVCVCSVYNCAGEA